MANHMSWNDLLQDMSKELNIAHMKIEELQMQKERIKIKKRKYRKRRITFMEQVEKGFYNFLKSPFKSQEVIHMPKDVLKKYPSGITIHDAILLYKRMLKDPKYRDIKVN